jgi:hypothetical protein
MHLALTPFLAQTLAPDIPKVAVILLCIFEPCILILLVKIVSCLENFKLQILMGINTP